MTLPNAPGSVIRWEYHWDGTNYRAAVLTYGQRWSEDAENVIYEGLMWHTTTNEVLTPEEMEAVFEEARAGKTAWRGFNFIPVEMKQPN